MALRREFEYVLADFLRACFVQSDFNFRNGDALRQLSAARVRFLPIAARLHLILTMQLWAIMLGNSSELFVQQCVESEFMDTVEDVLHSWRTTPLVRERLLEVIAAAAYASSEIWNESEHTFRVLWRKVKPAGMPDMVSICPHYPTLSTSCFFFFF